MGSRVLARLSTQGPLKRKKVWTKFNGGESDGRQRERSKGGSAKMNPWKVMIVRIVESGVWSSEVHDLWIRESRKEWECRYVVVEADDHDK